MRNVALAGVIGVLVAAGSLVGAPAAEADIGFECTPGCWGAIAASLSNGEEVLRADYRTQQKAEDAAVLWCDVDGKTNDCQVVTSGLGCLSIADSSDGKAVAGRTAFSLDAADAAALAGAGPGSNISLHDCN
jgi:Domain of unknown function (DUF4189)